MPRNDLELYKMDQGKKIDEPVVSAKLLNDES